MIPMEFPNPEGGTIKLDTPNPNMATFHCHQSNATGRPTICRGWLSVERDSIGARLLQSFGRIEPEDVPTEDESDVYYSTGTEACEAGLRDIECPSTEARLLAHRLVNKGAGHWEEGEDDDEAE